MKKENEELEKEMLAQFNVQELEERLEMKKPGWIKKHSPKDPNPDGAIIIIGN